MATRLGIKPEESLFDELVEEAFSLGVEIEIIQDGDVLWLSSIERTSGKKGAGSKVLEMLCEFAIDHDMIVKGQIEQNNEGLAEYYRNNGFLVEHLPSRTIITQIP